MNYLEYLKQNKKEIAPVNQKPMLILFIWNLVKIVSRIIRNRNVCS